MRAPVESEFNEWKSHPVTIMVMEILSRKREEMRQAWEGGSFSDYDERAMALTNVGNIGTCKGYAYVQELDYFQLVGEIDDNPKLIGIGATGSGGSD